MNVTAPESVQIALTDSLLNDQNPLVELRIGEDGNMLVQLIEGGQIKRSSEHRDLLSETEMRTFRVQWGLGTMMLFKNNDPNAEKSVKLFKTVTFTKRLFYNPVLNVIT